MSHEGFDVLSVERKPRVENGILNNSSAVPSYFQVLIKLRVL